jgi:hypothetical protein
MIARVHFAREPVQCVPKVQKCIITGALRQESTQEADS